MSAILLAPARAPLRARKILRVINQRTSTSFGPLPDDCATDGNMITFKESRRAQIVNALLEVEPYKSSQPSPSLSLNSRPIGLLLRLRLMQLTSESVKVDM
jgi:hypothetical protein